MARGTLAQRLIEEHLVEGSMEPGEPIAIEVDQTLTQDATGTLVMLELEAMGLDRVRTRSVQYVDHNLIQADFRNPDDHLFLESACRRFGIWFSRPGNGVSHPLHMELFGVPGETMVGSDSHTCAAGALGMLAVGVGGLEVALAMAGHPLRVRMPRVHGVYLEGRLPPFVSAKDVILEMLRRHDVDGGVGAILEYHGPGVRELSVWDRHVIANMGAELGATTTVFPSDERTRAFLRRERRGGSWRPLSSEENGGGGRETHIDLSGLEPLIATPGSPGNVVRVEEVADRPIYQAYLGSSANPGLRDYAVPAMMVADRKVPTGVSLDVNPSTRQVLESLTTMGYLALLLRAGARLHQAGCNGCIGMGQAPATGRNSLRTVPRNFPGRSGTSEDSVYLCSPETATASALRGKITDPRSLGMEAPRFEEPAEPPIDDELLQAPPEVGRDVALVRGPNIGRLPDLDPLPDTLEGPVLLKVGDHISTDEILPAGTSVLPFRSNIEAISAFAFEPVDEGYATRARERDRAPHVVVGGRNYGQGSSREHAALAPRYLGLRAVLALDFSRIHASNLSNFGILPLTFVNADDYERVEQGHVLALPDVREALEGGATRITAENRTTGDDIELEHNLSVREIEAVLEGSILPHMAEHEA